MKQKIFIILNIFMFVLPDISAQHALTSNRNTYRAGDKILKQQVEYKDPGISGKQQIWDFSMLQPLNEEYILDYFIPDSTQMDTICGMEHSTRYYYFQKHDSVWAVGFENATTYMKYPVNELRMRFPFAYGDSLFSRFHGEGEYCHTDSLHVKGYTRILADAEGELRLPGIDAIKKALRVRTIRHYTQTGKDSIEITLDTYSWYAKGVRYPVFESIRTSLNKKGDRTDENGVSLNDSTLFTTSFFYPPVMQSSQLQAELPLTDEEEGETLEIEEVFTECSFQPNPVVSNLNINFKLTRPAKVWFTVHTNNGVPVCQTATQNLPEGYNNTSIKMNKLITGTYTVYVHVDDMVMRQVVVKK